MPHSTVSIPMPFFLHKNLADLTKDARNWQILVLSGLLTYGSINLNFGLHPLYITTMLATSLLTQWVGAWGVSVYFNKKEASQQTSRAFRSASCEIQENFTDAIKKTLYDPRSALISGLSLCILLRVDHWGYGIAAAVIAIGSKFLIRSQGRHIFNPANLGIVTMVALSGHAWISPAQWGTATWAAVFMAFMAGLVLTRSRTADIAIGFLVFYIGFLFLRAAWLGDPFAIPLRQMQSGSLLLFAFHMISDPRTIPATRKGRLTFAAMVAAVATFLQFGMYMPEALLYALTICAPLGLFIGHEKKCAKTSERPS